MVLSNTPFQMEQLPNDTELDSIDLDEIEPVGDEAQLYEHFRVVVDKGQELMRVDKYLFDRLPNASRNRIQKAAGWLLAPYLVWVGFAGYLPFGVECAAVTAWMPTEASRSQTAAFM